MSYDPTPRGNVKALAASVRDKETPTMNASQIMQPGGRSDGQARIECTFHSGVPHISPHVLRRLPACVVRSERVVPIDLEGETLVVAAQDPTDFGLQERIRYISGRDLRVIAAPPA